MGAKVLNLIVESSGLPVDYTKNRLEKLLHESGFDPDKASLDEIRVVLSNLLQDLILDSENEDPA